MLKIGLGDENVITYYGKKGRLILLIAENLVGLRGFNGKYGSNTNMAENLVEDKNYIL